MASVIKVTGVDKLSGAQLRSLAKAAKEIGVPVDWLATIISFESAGSFSPSKLNAAGSGAFGLIQFLPSTAANMLGGTKTDAAARGRSMSFDEQLTRMVVPYFKSFATKFNSLQDLYLAVFYPRAMNKPDTFVIGSTPSQTYELNAGLDKSRKGYITRADVTHAITQHYGKASGRVLIPPTWAIVVTASIFSAMGLYFIQPHLPERLRLPKQYLKSIDDSIANAKRFASRNLPSV